MKDLASLGNDPEERRECASCDAHLPEDPVIAISKWLAVHRFCSNYCGAIFLGNIIDHHKCCIAE